jgi:hypothetical protein
MLEQSNRIAGPYTGDGATTEFFFGFPVFGENDVDAVAVDGLPLSNWTIVRDTNGNTLVKFLVAPEDGRGFNIVGVTPYEQPSEFSTNGGFNPNLVTKALDRMGATIQQVARDTRRSVKVPIDELTLVDTTLPDGVDRANKLLGFGPSGLPTLYSVVQNVVDLTSYATKTFAETITQTIPSYLINKVAPGTIRGRDAQWSIREFGNRSAGLETNPLIVSHHQLFSDAFNSGEANIRVPHGNYYFRESMGAGYIVHAGVDTAIDIDCANDATIFVGSEFGGPEAISLFEFLPAVQGGPVSQRFRWRGGVFDASGVGNPTEKTGVTLLDLFKYNEVDISGVYFYAGTSTRDATTVGKGYCDGAITTHNCNQVSVIGNRFTGFVDAAVYLSGSGANYPTTSSTGQRAIVADNFFYRCDVAIIAKRAAGGIIARHNHILEGVSGIRGANSTEDALLSYGRQWTITGNRLDKVTSRNIEIHAGYGDIISDNYIMDFGLLPDGVTSGSASAGDMVCGIALQGCVGANVHNNTIGYKEYNVPVLAGVSRTRAPHAIGLKPWLDNPSQGSTDCLIADNNILGAYANYYEGPNCDRNVIRRGVEFSVTNDALLTGASTLLIGSNPNAPENYSAAQIASITSIANTRSKYEGKTVYDTTGDRLMVATGGTAVSDWKTASGGGTVTPA